MTVQEDKDTIEGRIAFLLQMLPRIPDHDPFMPLALAGLGEAYEGRFDLTNEPGDLDKAVEYQSIALSMISDGDSKLLGLLDLLGKTHSKRFEWMGAVDDSEKAIEYLSLAISLTPDGDPDLPDRLGDLGVSHSYRYKRLGEPTDLEQAIECDTRAVALTPEGHPGLPRHLVNLGVSRSLRYTRLGELDDLDKSIECHTRAFDLTPDGHPQWPSYFKNLGFSHSHRYQRLGELADLEKAIECETRAVTLTPIDHPNLPSLLGNLGFSLSNRYKRLGEPSDLEKAIECSARAVSLAPQGHPLLPDHFTNLGMSHRYRHELLSEVTDFQKSIECFARAVEITPNGHPDLPSRLTNLGTSYKYRYECLGELTDLEKAIESYARAIVLLPDGHPHLLISHSNSAHTYLTRYTHSGDPSHLQAALNAFRSASQALTGSARAKFDHAYSWAKESSIHHSLNPIEAYQTTIDLLPQFVWLGATTHQRYQDLATTQSLAVDAACAAIRSSDFSLALEWLEQARCVVWNQSLMLRAPLDRLQTDHPALAAHLQTISNQLHIAGSQSRDTQSFAPGALSMEQVAQEHRRLAAEYDELLVQARKLPGLEDFLQPMKAVGLVRAARYGPVVVINCQTARCDALLIMPGQGNIHHVPLPNFTGQDAQAARLNVQNSVRSKGLRQRGIKRTRPSGQGDPFGSVLAGLWYKVVKPILDFLGYTRNVGTNDLPHITWCPTGVVSFLPLHAAGDYDQPHSRVFDYAVSSYTPTVTALLASTTNTFTANPRLLAICQEATPDHSPLPATARELECIQAHVQNTNQYTQLKNDKATTSAVLDAMEAHDWVHLACHAHQNVSDPTKSGFFLHDGTLDLAAINRRSFKNKGFAFLSACQTAKGDEELPDEAIHLASGMLMAGYSSVIATMWSVFDADAPLVADKIYEQLMRDRKLGNGEAGKALHKAVEELRERVGEKAFERWVPYIHIGS